MVATLALGRFFVRERELWWSARVREGEFEVEMPMRWA